MPPSYSMANGPVAFEEAMSCPKAQNKKREKKKKKLTASPPCTPSLTHWTAGQVQPNGQTSVHCFGLPPDPDRPREDTERLQRQGTPGGPPCALYFWFGSNTRARCALCATLERPIEMAREEMESSINPPPQTVFFHSVLQLTLSWYGGSIHSTMMVDFNCSGNAPTAVKEQLPRPAK